MAWYYIMKKAEVFETTYRQYIQQVAEIDLAARAKILGAVEKDGALEISFYGEPHMISKSGVFKPSGERASFAVCVLLCCYVLQSPDKAPNPGEWVTYREFKDAGPLVGYFTSNTNKIIEATFAGRIDVLKAACLKMGGQLVEEPAFDVACMFDMLPRIPVFFRFNDRDDTFPSQTSILFRQSAEKHIDMECLAIGGTYLTGNLIGNSAGDVNDSDLSR